MATFLSFKNENIVSETLWTFASLTDNQIQNGLHSLLNDLTKVEIAIPLIIKFGIFSNQRKIKYPAFRIIGNLSYGDDDILKVQGKI